MATIGRPQRHQREAPFSWVRRKSMAHTSCLCLLVLTLSSACATEAPWKATDPNERVLIPAADISDAELAGLDVPYEHYDGKLGRGYLVEKGSLCRSAGSDLDNQLK